MENGLLGWETSVESERLLRRLLVTVMEAGRVGTLGVCLEMTLIRLADGLDVVREEVSTLKLGLSSRVDGRATY